MTGDPFTRRVKLNNPSDYGFKTECGYYKSGQCNNNNITKSWEVREGDMGSKRVLMFSSFEDGVYYSNLKCNEKKKPKCFS